MKIAVTGTFSVPRSALEKALKDAGHEVVNLNKKTTRLLVGEKTASQSKVAKAEQLGIQIIRETDPQKILNLLGLRVSSYVSMYKRLTDIESGKTISVGVFDFLEVYEDFTSNIRDQGEWEREDMEWIMTSLTGGDGRNITGREVVEELAQEVGVKINPDERVAFLTGFYRLVVLDLLRITIEDEGIDCETKKSSSSLLGDEFYSKIFKFLTFYDKENEEEAKDLEAVTEFIQKRKAKEKDIGTVKAPKKVVLSREEIIKKIFRVIERQLSTVKELDLGEARLKHISVKKDIYSGPEIVIERAHVRITPRGFDDLLWFNKANLEYVETDGISTESIEKLLRATLKNFDCPEWLRESSYCRGDFERVNPVAEFRPIDIPEIKELWDKIKMK